MRGQREIRPYLTTTKAAKLCGLSASTVLRAIHDGKLKAFSTPGGHFRIDRASIEGLLRKPPTGRSRKS